MRNRLLHEKKNQFTMNRTLTILAAAALVAVGCNNAPSDQTALTLKFADEHPAEVHVKIGKKDTTVAVGSNVVTVSVPVDVTVPSLVTAGESRCRFISDGTKVTLDFTGEKPTFVGSPKTLNGKMKDFQDWLADFGKRYHDALEAVENDATLTEEQKKEKSEAVSDPLYKEYVQYNKDVVAANPDNILGLSALQNIYYEMTPEELSAVLDTFSPEMQEQDFIKRRKQTIAAQIQTGEGKMFTDFEIETEPGKKEKLSDYVGKGKYMLVDFWASWCGPCKREIPNLKNIYNKYHGDQFDILSVAVWDEPQASIDTAKAYGIPWNHMINGQRIPTDLYGVDGIPHIILFGPDGKILKRDLRGEAIGEEIAKYVK